MPATTHDNPSPAPAGLSDGPMLARVVLLGRTGLDARLRLDPAVELIRVRSPFDAMGELANPVMPVPPRTAVFLGGDVEIHESMGGAEALVGALRGVAPNAVVILCADDAANYVRTEPYDDIVSPELEIDALRRLVHGDQPVPAAASDQQPEDQLANEPEPDPSGPIGLAPASAAPDEDLPRPHEPLTLGLVDDDDSVDEAPGEVHAEVPPQPAEPTAPAPAPPAASPIAADLDDRELAALRTPTDSGPPSPQPTPPTPPPAPTTTTEVKPMPTPTPTDADGVLVAALLGGRSPLEPALGLIRARTGRTSIEFVPATEGVDAPRAGAEVRYGEQRFGWLTAGPSAHESIAATPPTGPSWLADQAAWLSSWLALAAAHQRLRTEAFTDHVSGAWNRRYFDRFLDAAIPHARERRHKLTVLVFDLDNFKSFNDRFGHEVGDEILAETVALMRSMTRPTDRICRIGGDEFAVIFYEPEGPRDKHSDHPEDFEVVAERFQQAVVEQRFPKLGIELPGELTISGGLATFPWDGQTPEDLLRRADELALESKRSGKNQIRFGGGEGSDSAEASENG
ncbi:MAG: GGDEF domain-containing protein [Planctomycetota bacterium]